MLKAEHDKSFITSGPAPSSTSEGTLFGLGYEPLNLTHLQGVNKVRRHCNITYNFSINVHSILKLYRHTDLFNTKVSTIVHLLQLYFI